MIIEITAVESTVTVHMELSEMRSIKVFLEIFVTTNKNVTGEREAANIM